MAKIWPKVDFYSAAGIDSTDEDLGNYCLLEAKDTKWQEKEQLKMIGRLYKKAPGRNLSPGIPYILLEYLPGKIFFAVDEADYAGILEEGDRLTICLVRECFDRDYEEGWLSAQIYLDRDGISLSRPENSLLARPGTYGFPGLREKEADAFDEIYRRFGL